MKHYFTFFFISLFLINCNSTQNITENSKIQYEEVLTVQHKINLPESSILKTQEEIDRFYKSIIDPTIPRQAPIPSLEIGKESYIAIKPTIQNKSFDSFEIESVHLDQEIVNIVYKEIKSFDGDAQKGQFIQVIRIANPNVKQVNLKLIQ